MAEADDDATTSARSAAEVAAAAHLGNAGAAWSALGHSAALVRRSALGALAELGELTAERLAEACSDPDPGVRRRAAELAAELATVPLRPLLEDSDPLVVEMAAWACGERGDPALVEPLSRTCRHHPDPMCREAAAAALGAIGHPSGLDAILAATADVATVRRRAVLALAPFQGERVEAALEAALADRDWQVRQVAEYLLDEGGGVREDQPGDPTSETSSRGQPRPPTT